MAEYLSVVQAAEQLQIHPNTLRAWIRNGFIDYRRLGRNIQIPQDAVDEMLERSYYQATTSTPSKAAS